MMSLQPALIRVHPDDSVAVALRPIAAGEEVALGEHSFTALAAVPQAQTGADHPRHRRHVGQYGQPIGKATAPIAIGDHVHTHNLATALAGELSYAPDDDADVAAVRAHDATWRGYLRADGRAGDTQRNLDPADGRMRRPDR
jgi:altronate hydrolase